MRERVRIVVLSPVESSPFSKLAIQLVHDEPGLEVAGVVVRTILNPARLRSELKRDGVRLVRKAWKKLVLGGDVQDSSRDEQGFFELAARRNLHGVSVSGLAKRLGLPVVKVADHNDPRAVAFVESCRPDAVAFTGGGILRKPLLAVAGRGVFNTHMGILPAYRGNDVVEWPIVEDRVGSVGLGVSVHTMATGVDTGPIANFQPVAVQPGDSMERLRKRFEPAMVRGLVQALRDLRDGRLSLTPQAIADGRQYFVMHPRFYEIARRKLARLAADQAVPAPARDSR